MHRLEEVLNLKNLYKYLIYLIQQKCVARCRVVVVLDCPVATKRSQAQPSALPLSCDNRRQVVHTLMPESRSIIYYMYIIWYQRCPMARRADATVIKNDPKTAGSTGSAVISPIAAQFCVAPNVRIVFNFSADCRILVMSIKCPLPTPRILIYRERKHGENYNRPK